MSDNNASSRSAGELVTGDTVDLISYTKKHRFAKQKRNVVARGVIIEFDFDGGWEARIAVEDKTDSLVHEIQAYISFT